MKLVHKPTREIRNNYNIEGLSVGKLISILDVLELVGEKNIGPVAYDVLMFLRHSDLENLEY